MLPKIEQKKKRELENKYDGASVSCGTTSVVIGLLKERRRVYRKMFEEIMAIILMKTVNPLLQKVWQTLSTRHMRKMT